MRQGIWLLCALVASACSEGTGETPGVDAAGVDAGLRDAARADSGPSFDAGVTASDASMDAGLVDAGAPAVDSGSDADLPDTGPPDAGPIMPTSATPIDCGMACCNGEIPFGTGACTNVALGGAVTASRVYTGGFPGEFALVNATDGETVCNSWNAGGYAPQWVAVDLGAVHTLAGLTLVAESVPATVRAHHILEQSLDGTSYSPIAVIDQDMTRAYHYEFMFASPVTTRHFRITTTRSPSWVAWREIAAFECP